MAAEFGDQIRGQPSHSGPSSVGTHHSMRTHWAMQLWGILSPRDILPQGRLMVSKRRNKGNDTDSRDRAPIMLSEPRWRAGRPKPITLPNCVETSRRSSSSLTQPMPGAGLRKRWRILQRRKPRNSKSARLAGIHANRTFRGGAEHHPNARPVLASQVKIVDVAGATGWVAHRRNCPRGWSV